MTERLLLAFDGSDDSRRAAAWAGALAAARGGVEIDLVHALTLPAIPLGGWEIPVGELLDRHEREMRDVVETERVALEAAGVPARVFVRRWLPVETLLEHAAERQVGLLVVGTHGQGFHRFRIGSTSAGVVRAASAPVAVVRGEHPVSPPTRVILGLDGSPAGAAAAAAAARWFPAARITAAGVADREPALDREEMLRALARAGVDAGRADAVELEGDPAAALLDFAETSRADLLAVGRRGGGSRLAGLLLGSVSEKLLQLAPCPLLVAH
jgi:nucleotide-binding universal stress UspA family protein